MDSRLAVEARQVPNNSARYSKMECSADVRENVDNTRQQSNVYMSYLDEREIREDPSGDLGSSKDGLIEGGKSTVSGKSRQKYNMIRKDERSVRTPVDPDAHLKVYDVKRKTSKKNRERKRRNEKKDLDFVKQYEDQPVRINEKTDFFGSTGVPSTVQTRSRSSRMSGNTPSTSRRDESARGVSNSGRNLSLQVSQIPKARRSDSLQASSKSRRGDSLQISSKSRRGDSLQVSTKSRRGDLSQGSQKSRRGDSSQHALILSSGEKKNQTLGCNLDEWENPGEEFHIQRNGNVEETEIEEIHALPSIDFTNTMNTNEDMALVGNAASAIKGTECREKSKDTKGSNNLEKELELEQERKATNDNENKYVTTPFLFELPTKSFSSFLSNGLNMSSTFSVASRQNEDYTSEVLAKLSEEKKLKEESSSVLSSAIAETMSTANDIMKSSSIMKFINGEQKEEQSKTSSDIDSGSREVAIENNPDSNGIAKESRSSESAELLRDMIDPSKLKPAGDLMQDDAEGFEIEAVPSLETTIVSCAIEAIMSAHSRKEILPSDFDGLNTPENVQTGQVGSMLENAIRGYAVEAGKYTQSESKGKSPVASFARDSPFVKDYRFAGNKVAASKANFKASDYRKVLKGNQAIKSKYNLEANNDFKVVRAYDYSKQSDNLKACNNFKQSIDSKAIKDFRKNNNFTTEIALKAKHGLKAKKDFKTTNDYNAKIDSSVRNEFKAKQGFKAREGFKTKVDSNAKKDFKCRQDFLGAIEGKQCFKEKQKKVGAVIEKVIQNYAKKAAKSMVANMEKKQKFSAVSRSYNGAQKKHQSLADYKINFRANQKLKANLENAIVNYSLKATKSFREKIEKLENSAFLDKNTKGRKGKNVERSVDYVIAATASFRTKIKEADVVMKNAESNNNKDGPQKISNLIGWFENGKTIAPC